MTGMTGLTARLPAALRSAASLSMATRQPVGRRRLRRGRRIVGAQGELSFQIRDLLLGCSELLVAVVQLTPKALILDFESVGRGAQRLILRRGLGSSGSLRLRGTHADRVDALIAAIPTVECRRLASLPSHLTPEETTRFLNAFDRRHASGQHGYAMARFLVDLGLRACEVAALQLEDLNWQDGTVRLGAGKSRRADVLPLPVLTGRAIVEYCGRRDRRAPVAPYSYATARRSMRRSRRRSCDMPCGWHSPGVALVPATPGPIFCDGRGRRRCDGPGPA